MIWSRYAAAVMIGPDGNNFQGPKISRASFFSQVTTESHPSAIGMQEIIQEKLQLPKHYQTAI